MSAYFGISMRGRLGAWDENNIYLFNILLSSLPLGGKGRCQRRSADDVRRLRRGKEHLKSDCGTPWLFEKTFEIVGLTTVCDAIYSERMELIYNYDFL